MGSRPLGMNLQSPTANPASPEGHWLEQTDLRDGYEVVLFLSLDIYHRYMIFKKLLLLIKVIIKSFFLSFSLFLYLCVSMSVSVCLSFCLCLSVSMSPCLYVSDSFSPWVSSSKSVINKPFTA